MVIKKKQEWNSRVYSINYLFYPDNISLLHSASKKLGNVIELPIIWKASHLLILHMVNLVCFLFYFGSSHLHKIWIEPINHLFTHFYTIITKTCKQSISFQNYKFLIDVISILRKSHRKLSCKYIMLFIIDSNVLIVTSIANVLWFSMFWRMKFWNISMLKWHLQFESH